MNNKPQVVDFAAYIANPDHLRTNRFGSSEYAIPEHDSCQNYKFERHIKPTLTFRSLYIIPYWTHK